MSRSSKKTQRDNPAKPRLRGRFLPRLEHLEGRTTPALFVVNTLADNVDPDPDFTSLREALIGANANSGADTVQFNIVGDIAVGSALPDLSDTTGGTTIDGTTAPGYAGTPLVGLYGPGISQPIFGLRIVGAPNNFIKGLEFANFANGGIEVTGATGGLNVITANSIGFDGVEAFPNGHGIVVTNGGGPLQINENVIAFNDGDGVHLTSTAGGGVQMTNNSFFNNGGLGIDLVSATDNASGVTPNDALDADTGPNSLHNAPVIAKAIATGAGTEITYSLHAAPNTFFVVQIYASSTGDPSGYGEGRTLLTNRSLTTDAKGNAGETFTAGVVTLGNLVTATAMSSNTSEFSNAVPVMPKRTWTGGGATSHFSDPANWGGTAPIAGDHLEFGPGTPTNLVNDFAPGTSFGSLKFAAGGFVLGGNSLRVGAGIDVRGAAGTSVTVNADISVANDLLPYIEQDNLLPYIEQDNVLQFNGMFTGGFGLEKMGRGTMILSGANTYTGVTQVTEGVVTLRHAMALGSTAGETVLREGSRLELDNVQIMGETLTIQSSGGFLQGELRSVNEFNSWSGPIQLPSHIDPICNPIRSMPGSVMTLSGVISGGPSAEIAKFGGGTLILSGANTFSGQAKIVGGVLNIRNALALGSSVGDTIIREGTRLELENVQVMGETLTVQQSGGFLQGELRSVSGNNSWGGAIQLPNHIDPICNPIRSMTGSVMTLSGVISGGPSAEIAKFGGGTVILSGANTFSGQAKIVEGTVRIRNSMALGSLAGITELIGGATLESEGNLDLNEGLIAVGSPPGSQFPAVTIRNVSGLLKINDARQINPLLQFEIASGTVIVTSEIAGDDDIEVEGPGTLVLESDNDELNGTITLKSGSLIVNGDWGVVPVIVEGGSLSGSGIVGPITVEGGAIEGAIMQASPLVPGQLDLVVGGTTGNDDIDVNPASNNGVQVTLNGTSLGNFAPTGRVLVYGQAGNDDVQAHGNLGRPA